MPNSRKCGLPLLVSIARAKKSVNQQSRNQLKRFNETVYWVTARLQMLGGSSFQLLSPPSHSQSEQTSCREQTEPVRF